MIAFPVHLLLGWWFIAGCIGIVIAMIIRYRLYQVPLYRYSLVSSLYKNNILISHPHRIIKYIVRCIVLVLLALAMSKPQLVDFKSQISVKGIDIVLVLDVSSSMSIASGNNDNQSRFDVAKQEALRFISKRDNDAIGLVLFGQDTISRCPITLDKHLLKQIIEELQLGVINADATMLVTGMITAANRLKHSTAKSKIMILLTDGEPSEGDMDVNVGIEIVKKLGIKVYTIGIGFEGTVTMMHPLYGPMQLPGVNSQLLTHIAQSTGGNFFMAHDRSDMRLIYDIIDTLEKVDHDVPLFSVYHDLLYYFLSIIMVIIILELLLTTFVWFSL